jgi:hypothetical protein
MDFVDPANVGSPRLCRSSLVRLRGPARGSTARLRQLVPHWDLSSFDARPAHRAFHVESARSLSAFKSGSNAIFWGTYFCAPDFLASPPAAVEDPPFLASAAQHSRKAKCATTRPGGTKCEASAKRGRAGAFSDHSRGRFALRVNWRTIIRRNGGGRRGSGFSSEQA